MQVSQDETEVLLASSAEDFLAQEHSTERLRAAYAGQAAHSREFWRQLAAQGWLALRLPEPLGGSELQARHVCLLGSAFGQHIVPEPLIACALMPSVLAGRLPGSPAWAPLLAGLQDGSHVATLAWQEDPQSLDNRPMATLATREAEGFALTGVKHCVPAASFSDSLLVTAEIDGTAGLFVLPGKAPGVTIDERLTSDGGTIARITLDKVEVPGVNLLGQGGSVLAAVQSAVDEALLAVTAQLLGIGKAGLALTLEYMRTRVQFGRHIGSFQSLQHMAVDVRIQQALAEAAHRSALQQYEAAPGSAETRAAIAAAKARACDAAIAAGRFGVQAHGAIGFAAEAEIGLYLKSALRLAAFLGNAPFHRSRYTQLTSSTGREA